MKHKTTWMLSAMAAITLTVVPVWANGNVELQGEGLQVQEEAVLEDKSSFAGESVEEGLTVDEENFPDKAFRDYVAESADTNGDGRLSDDELAAVTEIEAADKGISDLKGLEHFMNLESLDLRGNELVNVDLSRHTALRCVDLSANKLQMLDVEGCALLEQLNVTDNQLDQIDISACCDLEVFKGSKNRFTKLDFSKCTQLIEIYATQCELEEVQVSNLRKLRGLALTSNELRDIDLSGCDRLDSLALAANYIPADRIEELKAYRRRGTMGPQKETSVFLGIGGTVSFEDLGIELASWDYSVGDNLPMNQIYDVEGGSADMEKECFVLDDFEGMKTTLKFSIGKNPENEKFDEYINIEDTFTVSVETDALSSPITTVTTESVSANSVRIRWENIDGAESYIIYRANSKDGSYKEIGTSEDGEEGFLDEKDLKPNSGHKFYVVRAVVGDEKGPWDKSLGAEGVSKPADAGFTKAFVHKNAIRVECEASGAEGYEFSYRFGDGQGEDTEYQQMKDQKKGVYTFKKLKESKKYVIKVRPYKIVGDKKIYSESTAYVTGKAAVQKTPLIDMPGEIQLIDGYTHKLAIRVDVWAKDADGYEFYIRKGGDNQEYKKVQTGKKKYCTFKNLKNGQKYVVKILAYKTVDGQKTYSIDPAYVTGRAAKSSKYLL